MQSSAAFSCSFLLGSFAHVQSVGLFEDQTFALEELYNRSWRQEYIYIYIFIYIYINIFIDIISTIVELYA